MIYQCLTTGEIAKLKIEDIDLENATIYIPRTKRGNSRVLQLKSHQILQLQHYVVTVRPVIIQLTNKKTENLFTSTGTSKRMSNSYMKMIRVLKKINPKIKSAKQVRASVITHWLKIYNIREVQYKIGHKYVSSTERYKTDKLESLQEQIEKYHPLNNQ